MAKCAMCGTKIGLLGKSLKLGLEKESYCLSCAEKWYKDENKRMMTELYEGGLPTELFCIRKVLMADPDEKGVQLGGDLMFLDKGVCFAALMEHKPPDTATAGALFGVIGAAIAQSKAKKALKKAWAAVPGGGEQRTTDDLARFLYGSTRLLVFPRHEVVGVNFSFWTAFGVTTVDKRHRFILENGRKTYKQYKDQIQEYLRG